MNGRPLVIELTEPVAGFAVGTRMPVMARRIGDGADGYVINPNLEIARSQCREVTASEPSRNESIIR